MSCGYKRAIKDTDWLIDWVINNYTGDRQRRQELRRTLHRCYSDIILPMISSYRRFSITLSNQQILLTGVSRRALNFRWQIICDRAF